MIITMNVYFLRKFIRFSEHAGNNSLLLAINGKPDVCPNHSANTEPRCLLSFNRGCTT